VVITVRRVIPAQQVTDGAGVKLNRVFGYDTRMETDPFLLLDYFGSENPTDYAAGFPWHPHRGIETITYMLQGKVEHSDSLGNRGEVNPGGVQWMSAGSGIIHQEMPKPISGLMYGFQLWLNLPRSFKMVPPTYHDLKSSDIPEVETSSSRVRVIAGRFRKAVGLSTPYNSSIDVLDVRLWPDALFDEALNANSSYFLFVYDGQISFADYSKPIGSLNGVILDKGSILQLKAESNGANFLLFGGQPINEPIAWRGPIVMNTNDELSVAFEEINQGTFIKE